MFCAESQKMNILTMDYNFPQTIWKLTWSKAGVMEDNAVNKAKNKTKQKQDKETLRRFPSVLSLSVPLPSSFLLFLITCSLVQKSGHESQVKSHN